MSFAKIRCFAIALISCSFVASIGADDETPPAGTKTERTAVVIPMHGEISGLTGAMLERRLQDARELGADVVIIDIDSPGGRADTSFQIARKLRSLDWAETIAYIDSEAISGAAIVALGCDKIVMRDSAMIGDAGVIAQHIIGGPFKYAPEKILSKFVADIRSVADAGGRPEALAEAMMNKDVKVFEATHKEDGRTWYFSESEWESMDDADRWTKGKPVLEARGGHFLTVNGKRAVELQLAEGVVDSRSELYELLRVGDNPQVLRQTTTDKVVWILNWPFITFLLFVIGLFALLVEFSAPGLGMGGLVSALCFGLFFWSRFLGGTAGWLEVMLFLIGILFIACELFVIPGFGVPGISGALLVLGSLVMASRHVVWPQTQRDLSELTTTVTTVGASIIAFGILTFFASRYMFEFSLFRSLALLPPSAESTGVGVAATVGSADPSMESAAPWQQVEPGDEGVANSPLRPAGKVAFDDLMVDVVTEGDFVESGVAVKIIQKQGTRIVVRAI